MKIMRALISNVEDRILTPGTFESYHKWIVFSSYAVLTCFLSLCGSGGFQLDLKVILESWRKGGDRYIVVQVGSRSM